MTLPDDIELRQDISDIEMYTKDGEAIDFIHPEHLDKIMELVNKYNGTVDLSAPKVNLIDIASPNMTPEASKVVSDAIERSAEVMNKTAKPVENGELRDKAHKTLDVYLDGGGPYEFVIVNKDDYERTIEARLAERAKLKEVK